MIELDRVDILRAVVPALQEDLRDWRPGGEEAATGSGRLVARTAAVLAGLGVAREALARVGVRMRELRRDGDAVRPGDTIAEIGGPVRAIEAAGGTALRFLSEMSAVATRTEPDHRSSLAPELAAYAREVGRSAVPPSGGGEPLSGPRVRGQNGVDFAIEVEA